MSLREITTKLKNTQAACSKNDEKLLAWASFISGALGIAGMFTGMSQARFYSDFQELYIFFWASVVIQILIATVLLTGASFLVTKKTHSHFYYWKVYGFIIFLKIIWLALTYEANSFFENRNNFSIAKNIADSYPSSDFLFGLTPLMSLCVSLCLLLFIIESWLLTVRFFSSSTDLTD